MTQKTRGGDQRRRDSFLQSPLVQLRPDDGLALPELLERMAQTSYQGRNLGEAYRVWDRMLSGKTTIFLALAGAMTAAGMRSTVAYLLKNRLVDCLVSTGANLSHDVLEIMGYHHYRGHPSMDDVELGKLGINRVFDNVVLEEGFVKAEDFVTDYALSLEQRPYTTREFLYRLGGRLREVGQTDGILTAAHEAEVPVYCPAIADSSMGMGLANARFRGATLQIDVLQDVVETATIVRESQRSGRDTGLIVIGGGTPRNFSQQSAIATYFFNDDQKYEHKYVVIITTDAPHWGGLSGSTPQEAQSWRKFRPEAEMVTVYCDATIAVPLLSSAVVQVRAHSPARDLSRFEVGQPVLALEMD